MYFTFTMAEKNQFPNEGAFVDFVWVSAKDRCLFSWKLVKINSGEFYKSPVELVGATFEYFFRIFGSHRFLNISMQLRSQSLVIFIINFSFTVDNSWMICGLVNIGNHCIICHETRYLSNWNLNFRPPIENIAVSFSWLSSVFQNPTSNWY